MTASDDKRSERTAPDRPIAQAKPQQPQPHPMSAEALARPKTAANDPQPQPQAAPQPMSGEQLATPPTSAPYIDTLAVNVLCGPYRGNVLHLPNDAATQAIADKWAVLHEETPFDPTAELAPPLTDEEQAAALAAANAYAQSLVEPPPDPEPPAPPPEDAQRRRAQRDMHSGGQAGSYETKEK